MRLRRTRRPPTLTRQHGQQAKGDCKVAQQVELSPQLLLVPELPGAEAGRGVQGHAAMWGPSGLAQGVHDMRHCRHNAAALKGPGPAERCPASEIGRRHAGPRQPRRCTLGNTARCAPTSAAPRRQHCCAAPHPGGWWRAARRRVALRRAGDEGTAVCTAPQRQQSSVSDSSTIVIAQPSRNEGCRP